MVSALLCDLGVFVLQQLFPAEYGPVLTHTPDVLAYRQCELEEEHLGLNHAEVARASSCAAAPARRHRRADPPPPPPVRHRGPVAARRPRSRLLYLAARIAQLQIAPNSQPALLREVLALACDGFGLSESAFVEFLEPLNRKIDEFAAVLHLDPGSLANYPSVVANATVELLQLNPEGRAEEEVLRWRRIAHRLRREATRDRLTGAFNRVYFDEALPRSTGGRGGVARRWGCCSSTSTTSRESTSLGRPFGEQVLKEVAASLRNGVRADDVVAPAAATGLACSPWTPRPKGWRRWPTASGTRSTG